MSTAGSSCSDQRCNSVHCKDTILKIRDKYPRKGIAWPQSQFPQSCVCERFIDPHGYGDRSWEYINRSQTHECGYWDRGRAISFLGIHEWDFRCSVGRCNHKIYAVFISRKRIHFDALLILLKLPSFGVKSKNIKRTKDDPKSLRLGSYLFKKSAAIVCLFEIIFTELFP